MIGGVVLAAGASRRAGTVKALALVEGETFVGRTVRVLREGGCGEVVVVLGPPHAEAIAPAVGAASAVHNAHPERGMLSSLKVGLRDEWEAAVVALVDHPRVRASTVAALVAAWREGGAEVVRPRHGGRRGHPYLVARAVFDALRAGGGEGGARPILAARVGRDVEVDDPFIHEDLDTAEELEGLARG